MGSRRDGHAARPPSKQPGTAEALGARAGAAARAAANFYRGWRVERSGVNPMDVERRRQAERHKAALAEYRSRLSRLRVRFATGTAMIIGGAAIATSEVGEATEPSLMVLGGGAAALGAWQAWKSRKAINVLVEPAPPPPLVGPPLPLPQDGPAADAASQVTILRMHIIELLPALEHVHAEAAQQVRAADAAAAPSLNALVERIRSMQRIQGQLPDSPAAQSAGITINALVIRLRDGVIAYQDLLGAVIALSSAPALEGPPAALLRPAIEDLRAYATGLERAGEVWR